MGCQEENGWVTGQILAGREREVYSADGVGKTEGRDDG